MPKVVFCSFIMGDVEDPHLYAAFPIAEWQKTERGAWCMEHAVGEPVVYYDTDPMTCGYQVKIIGELSEPNITFLKLKWSR